MSLPRTVVPTLLATFLLSVVLSGQTGVRVTAPNDLRYYDDFTGRGLRCLTGDAAGRIIVATDAGVFRYDGHEFAPTPGTAGDVRSLCVRRNGDLLAGTDYGLFRLERERWEALLPDLKWEVDSILEDPRGVVWCATRFGLVELREDVRTLHTFRELGDALGPRLHMRIEVVPAGLPVRRSWRRGLGFRRADTRSGGYIWLVADGGPAAHAGLRAGDRQIAMTRGRNKEGKQVRTFVKMTVEPRDGGPLREVVLRPGRFQSVQTTFELSALAARGGDILVTRRRGGLLRYSPEAAPSDRWEQLLDIAATSWSPRLLVAADGAIWVGGPEKAPLRRFDGRDWRVVDLVSAGGSDSIFALIQGGDGRIWVGTRGELFSFDGRLWTRYANRLPHVYRPMLYASESGALWIGNPGGQLVQLLDTSDRWRSEVAWRFAGQDPGGAEWFVSERGVRMRGADGSERVYSAADGLPDRPVDLCIRRSGAVAGYGGSGTRFATFELGRDRFVTTEHPSLPAPALGPGLMFEDSKGVLRVAALLKDGDRAALLENRAGTWKLHGHTVFGKPLGFAETVSGLWFASSRGVRLLGRQVGFAMTPLPPTFDRVAVTGVATDAGGHLWVANSVYGFFRLADDRWERFAGPAAEHDRVRGLCALPNGELWAATAGGICRFDEGRWFCVLPNLVADDLWLRAGNDAVWFNRPDRSDRYAGDRTPPETYLTTAQDRVTAGNELTLTWRGSDPWRETHPDELTFSYRIDGGPWSPWEHLGVLRLRDAGIGAHVFEVRARDVNLNVDPTPAELRFDVVAPLWQRTWFVALMLLLGGAVVFQTIRAVRRGRQLGIDAARAEAAELARRQLEEEIEARKRVEATRTELEAQLVQAQKMEAIGQLAGGVAHDFNNILTAVLGHSSRLEQLLREHPELATEFESSVAGIDRAADRAVSLTRQLLTIGRRQVTIPTVLDPNRLLHEMHGMLARVISEDIRLEFDLEEDLAHIAGDRAMFEQVVMNLVVNARDAMPAGGSLRIETRNAPDGARERVRLRIQDTGIGMDGETVSRIFEPFFTTKPAAQGTGLGLSTVFGIIEQAGGHIVVESSPGAGSCFDVFLPATKGRASTATARAGVRTAARGGATVLVCEDEDVVRELTCETLRAQGYDVLAAGSGEEAVRISSEYAGTIDLLVTDVIMPGMNGRELARALCAEREGLRVLYVSGYATDVLARRGVLDSDVDLLHKPFSPAQLLERADTAISAAVG